MTAACEGKITKMRRTKPNNNPATMLLMLMMSPLLLLLRRYRHSSSPVAMFVLGDAGVDGSVDGVVDRGGGGGGGRMCLTEADLDFEDCDLDDLDDGALAVSRSPSSSPAMHLISLSSLNSVGVFPLSSMSDPFTLDQPPRTQDICGRIGLDMDSHVLPFLSEDEDDPTIAGRESSSTTRTHAHADYVRAAEECLLIEDEMERLEVDDPEYLSELEREVLRDDPTIVAEIIENVLEEDEELLRGIASKLIEDAPEIVREMEGMLGEGERLEGRPDVVAFIVARLLSDDQNLDLLDEFDAALSASINRVEEEEEEEKENWHRREGEGKSVDDDNDDRERDGAVDDGGDDEL